MLDDQIVSTLLLFIITVSLVVILDRVIGWRSTKQKNTKTMNTPCEQKIEHEFSTTTNQSPNVDTADSLSMCANCGKGEEENGILKSCNACKLVKYCSRDCQITHRPMHKKECKKRAAELHEEALFKTPPPPEDCDICMLPLPPRASANTYYSCCGKTMCKGCDLAYHISDSNSKSDTKCPYCRKPTFAGSLEGISNRFEERMKAGDANAYHEFGRKHWIGRDVTQDRHKAMELWHKAASMGCTAAYHDICDAYYRGQGGVERDMKKCRYYCELAAMGGYVKARMDLGLLEINAGNTDKALKHLLIAAGCGSSQSLDVIKQLYSRGGATKDDYTKALQDFQSYLGEIRSKQRDEAAKFHESCKYY